MQGSGSQSVQVVRSESSIDPSSETVPEAAKILYAQLNRLHNHQSGSKSDAQKLALHNSLGHVYEDSGNYPQAIKHYSLARDQAAKLGDSAQIVAMQTTLGSVYATAGRLPDARRELESAFLLMDRSGPNTFTTMRALANVRRDSGKLDEALTLYGETLRLRESQGASVDNVAGVLNDMGQAFHSKGQLDVAMSHYQQALDKVTDATKSLPTTGTAAQELAEIYSNIGQAYHEKGDVEKAGEYYRKALRTQQRALRENHPCITETLINLARLQRDSGAGIDVALASLAKAEVLLKGRETHREFANILMVKADFLREAQRLKEAEAAAVRARDILESLASEETPDLAVMVNGLGSILHDQRKYQDAVKQYMRALTINMKTVGSSHPETAATYNNLGNVYQDAGDDGAAERYYRKTLEIQRAISSNDTPDVAATYNNIGTILARHGRLTEAKELLMKAVDVVHKAGLPPGSPERAIYEENLREVQQRLTGAKQEQKAQIV
jgi:tetratricopeptide (TPR) repeat protein